MATTSDGIWTPDQSDPFDLASALATTAATVQSALDTRANAYRGTSAARTSFTSQAPEGTIWVDTTGNKAVWAKQGASWTQIYPVSKGGISGLPYAMAAGEVILSGGSGSRTSRYVSFPSGRFTHAPVVTMTFQGTAVAGLQTGYGVSGTDRYGFTAWSLRSNASDSLFHWVAIQMTPSSGAG